MTETKTGRNENCSCGSGKKYKKCCLAVKNPGVMLDFAWRKLRNTEGSVVDNHLIPYFVNKLPETMMSEARNNF